MLGDVQLIAHFANPEAAPEQLVDKFAAVAWSCLVGVSLGGGDLGRVISGGWG